MQCPESSRNSPSILAYFNASLIPWSLHSSQVPSELRILIRVHGMRLPLWWLLTLTGSHTGVFQKAFWNTEFQPIVTGGFGLQWAHLLEDISLSETIFLPSRTSACFVLSACLSNICRVELAVGIKEHAWWTEWKLHPISYSSKLTSISYLSDTITPGEKQDRGQTQGCCYSECYTSFSAVTLKVVKGHPQTNLARMKRQDNL